MQAMPSPRPIQPIPSLLVALTLTRAEVASASDPLHLGPVGAEARLLADHGGVDVDDRPGDRADHGAQQVDRVGAPPALVVVGEHRADVAAAAGAEDGVDHRVGEDVGVGVAGEAALVLDLDPAEDQRAARRRSGGCRSRCRPSAQPTRLAERRQAAAGAARRRISPPPRAPSRNSSARS